MLPVTLFTGFQLTGILLATNNNNFPILRAVSEKYSTSSVCQRTFEDGCFAIGKPLFQYRVTAEFVVPDRSWNITPESVFIQIDVKGGIARGLESIIEGLRIRPA